MTIKKVLAAVALAAAVSITGTLQSKAATPQAGTAQTSSKPQASSKPKNIQLAQRQGRTGPRVRTGRPRARTGPRIRRAPRVRRSRPRVRSARRSARNRRWRPGIRRRRGTRRRPRIILRVPSGPYYYDYDYVRRLSCSLAAQFLRDRGYRNVRAYDCRGSVYGFRARRSGRRYTIRVSAYSGAILSRNRY